jgi:GT2 family glycosyltransferase
LPPEISVVVPTFRRPALVVEAVRSALAQEGVEVEVTVVDDSPEGSAEAPIASLADPRLSYHRMSSPTGGRPALVRNQGFKLTRGPLVHFLDDDDRVEPGAYADVARAFRVRPRCGVVFGRVEPFGAEPGVLEHEHEVFNRAAHHARIYQRLRSRRLPVAHTYFCGPLFVNSACLVRREAVEAVGGYDPEIAVTEDLDFFTRAIRAAGFAFLDRVILQYRIGSGSLMDVHRHGSAQTLAASRRMYAKYRARHGRGEFLALHVLAKLVLRWL